jgi:hypothetical protein
VGLDDAALREEVQLRMPGRTLLRRDDPRPEGELAYAGVRRDAADLRLTIVLANGDAYDQVVADVPGQSERAAAASIAALLDAIAAGDVAPTRTEVEIPEPEPPPAPEPEPESEPEPKPKPEPEPPPPEPKPEPKPEPPALEVAPVLAPSIALGLAPVTDASVFAGAGGSLGVDLRGRRGWLAMIDARVLGRSAEGLAAVRARLALGGGWAWRRGALEVPLAGALTVEPWWVRRAGSGVDLRDGTDAVGRRPALGAALRVSPGLFVPRTRPRAPALRIGARAEVAGSFVPDGGLRTVEIGIDEAGGREAALRIGGLELVVGLEVALWFGVGRRP